MVTRSGARGAGELRGEPSRYAVRRVIRRAVAAIGKGGMAGSRAASRSIETAERRLAKPNVSPNDCNRRHGCRIKP